MRNNGQQDFGRFCYLLDAIRLVEADQGAAAVWPVSLAATCIMPPYGLYGVRYIDLVSLTVCAGLLPTARRCGRG